MSERNGRPPATQSEGDAAPDDIAAVEREIERTRAQLAHDIDRLAAKADVVGRTRDRVHEVGETRVAAVGGVVAAAVLALAVVVVRRRRGGRR